MNQDRNIILTINVVEEPLVRAVHLQSKALGKKLEGLVLVHKEYAKLTNRPKDRTGLFKEIICDFDNIDEVQAVLKPYHDRLLAVTCRYEEAIQPFGKVIPFLPYLYTPSGASLLWSTEKNLMRDRMKNYDSSLGPRYQYMQAADMPKLDELIKDFEFPVIIKPCGLAKALFVTECDDMEELRENLEKIFEVIENAYTREQYPGEPSLLVEEMMQGDMYSTDAYITHDGKISCLPLIRVTTAHELGLPGFYGRELTTITNLSDSEIQAAFKTTISGLRALNLSSTSAHIELFNTPTGWKIIEIAARIGGHRDDLYREAYGFEHFFNDLSIRMGKDPVVNMKAISNATAVNIYADQEGYIDAIEGLEKARKLESVVYLHEHAKPGDLALFAMNGGDNVIDGVLRNDDPKKLREDIKRVNDLVNIKIRQTAQIQKTKTVRRPRRELIHS